MQVTRQGEATQTRNISAHCDQLAHGVGQLHGAGLLPRPPPLLPLGDRGHHHVPLAGQTRQHPALPAGTEGETFCHCAVGTGQFVPGEPGHSLPPGEDHSVHPAAPPELPPSHRRERRLRFHHNPRVWNSQCRSGLLSLDRLLLQDKVKISEGYHK